MGGGPQSLIESLSMTLLSVQVSAQFGAIFSFFSLKMEFPPCFLLHAYGLTREQANNEWVKLLTNVRPTRITLVTCKDMCWFSTPAMPLLSGMLAQPRVTAPPLGIETSVGGNRSWRAVVFGDFYSAHRTYLFICSLLHYGWLSFRFSRLDSLAGIILVAGVTNAASSLLPPLYTDMCVPCKRVPPHGIAVLCSSIRMERRITGQDQAGRQSHTLAQLSLRGR
jgi:hypothetical protein